MTCDQSAFRRGHSTATSAHTLLDDLMDNINEGQINGICFFDLKKCVDTIDHELLLYKLKQYGVDGIELFWFADYLSNRSQTVAINGSLSGFQKVLTGVPQGSVLGPLLFLYCYSLMNSLNAANTPVPPSVYMQMALKSTPVVTASGKFGKRTNLSKLCPKYASVQN